MWLEQHIKPNCSFSYYSNSKYITTRIRKVIGNYQLNEITPIMVQKYIDSRVHHNIKTKLAPAKPNLSAIIKKQKIFFEKLANVCSATVRTILGGENIQLAKAEEIAKALGVAVSSVFDIKIETKYPTTSTVAKHFRTLRAILSVAKKATNNKRKLCKI